MGLDFNALREKARRIDESEKGQRERQADSRRAVEEAARERHGFDGSAMWQLADDMEARQQAGRVSSAVKTAQGVASAAAPGLSRLGQLAEEIAAKKPSGSIPAAVQAQGYYINSRYQSGLLPGTPQGAEPVGAGSFGGVQGYQNIGNAAQIGAERQQRYLAQQSAMQTSRQLEQIRQILEAQSREKQREAEALLPDASLKNLTLDSFQRGYENSIAGQEAFQAMYGLPNEREERLERLGREQFQFYPKGLVQKAVSGAAEQLGQQVRQWTDPRSVAMGGIAAGGAFLAGNAGPQALVPEEIITVPAAFTSGIAAGSAISNMEIEAGMVYNEMLENGIAPETAKTIAIGVGGVNAALEGLQLDELVKGLKVAGGKSATRNVAMRIIEELGRRGLDIGNETVQELLQEGVTIAGAQAANKYQTGDWAYSAEEVADRLKDTAISSALTFGMMNVPGAVRSSLSMAGGQQAFNGQVSGGDSAQNRAEQSQATQSQAVQPQVAQAKATQEQVTQPQPQGPVSGYEERLGENGLKNYRWLRERSTVPDLEGQHNHYYDLGRIGLPESELWQYATETPILETEAKAAFLAGQNDGSAEAAKTVIALFEGKAVSDTALERALAFPNARKAMEKVTGPLPQSYAQARKSVREWVRENVGAVQETAREEQAIPEQRPAQETRDTQTIPGHGPAQETRDTQAMPEQVSTQGTAEPGVVRNEASGRISREAVDTIDRIAKRVGAAVEFSDAVKGNGEYRDGKITIRADAENPVRQVFVHELTHHLETSGGYQAFADRVIGYLQESGQDVELQIAAIAQDYARQGVPLSEDGARREVVAKFAEEYLFTNERSIRKLVQEDRSLGQKIRDWLHDMLIRLSGDEQQKFVLKAEQMYAKALEGEVISIEKDSSAPFMTGSGQNGGLSGDATLPSSAESMTQPEINGKPRNPSGQKSYGGGLSELNARLAQLSDEEKQALKDENKRQRERIAYLERQLKRTPPEKRSEVQVRKIARDVLSAYESKADRADIAKRLQALYDGMNTGGERALSANLYQGAVQIAADIVKESSHLNDELAQQYKGLRDQLRTTGITLSGADRLSIAEGYGEFRKRYFGRIKLVNEDGTPVDTMYEQLRGDYGEAFFPADITHQADQLERIGEVLDSLRPVYENPYANAIGDAAHTLALDLLARGAAMDPAPKTIADRFADQTQELQRAYDAELKLRQAAQEDVKRAEAELRKERERRAGETEALKAYYQKLDAERRERKLDRIQREKLFKVAKRVERMHATPQNRAKIEELVGTLDLLGIGIRQNTELRLSELRETLQEVWEKRKAIDPKWEPDERLARELKRLDNTQIAGMKIEDVEFLTKALLAIEHTVYNENRMTRTKDRRDVYAQAQETIRIIEQAESPGTQNGIFSKNGYLSAMLSPKRYVRRLMGYDENSPLCQLTKDLSDGQRKMQDFEMRSERFFDKWHSNREFMAKLTGKKAQRIAIQDAIVRGGKTEIVQVEITPAQQVSLYLHNRHAENRRHITEGGVVIPDAELYADGKHDRAFADGVHLQLDEDALSKLTYRMDADVRAYAEAISQYMNGMARDAINEASVALDGYERARVENYFPIHTDPDFNHSESELVKRDKTIKGMGMLKERTHGQNPLLLEDVTDVLERHIQSTARYYGLAIPVNNFNKLLAATGTGSKWSVRRAIREKWGSGAVKYLDEMLSDVQGARKGGQDSVGRMISQLRSNSAGAVLTLNPSVIMKQAASYPTAAGVLGWKPLLRALSPQAFTVDMDTIARYTPDYWYRRKGYSTTELGDITSRKKGLPKLLNLIQGVDLATTRTLWLASEYYVRDRNRGRTDAPEIRSDAYYRQVAEVYNRVIEETQPNYSVMQRPGILRTQNELVKSLVMFKTQSFQNFNMLYDAYGNWRAKARAYALEGSEANHAALREARAGLVRNVSAQVVSAAVLSGMTFAAAVMLGRTGSYMDDDEDRMTAESVTAQLAKDFVGSLSGMALGGSEAWSALNALALDGTWYDVEAGGVSSINDLFSRFSGVKKAAEDLWKAYGDDEQELTTAQVQHLVLQGLKLAKTTAETFGLPANNLGKLLHAVGDWAVKKACGKYLGQYYSLLTTTSAENNSGAYIDLLYQAYKADSPEYEQLHELINDLGIDDDRIANGLKAREGTQRLLKSLLKARRKGDEESREEFRQALLDGGLKTEKQIRDAEYSSDNSEVTEIFKAAYRAQENSDAETLESLRQELLEREYTDEEIGEKLYALHVSGLQKTKPFEDAQSEVFVRIFDEGTKHPGYEMLDRWHREKFRNNVSIYSTEFAMAEFEPDYKEKSWVTACRDAQRACGLSESQFIIAYSSQAGVESIRNKDGEAISNSASLRKMQAIYSIPGLSDQQRAYLFEACGVGKEVRHYNKALVEQKLREMEREAAK